jgi:hypothetical protein
MISFSWAPPFHTGGGDLLEYYLSYEEEVPAYNQEAGKLNQRVGKCIIIVPLYINILFFSLWSTFSHFGRIFLDQHTRETGQNKGRKDMFRSY